MNGGGKGGDNRGNRRRPFKRRERENTPASWPENKGGKKTGDTQRLGEGKFETNRGGQFERPRWIAPKPPAGSIPTPDCPWCGKPIKDMSAAISDKNSGEPVHFDCVIARLGEGEALEPGDTISYIGGGRFGIIHLNNPPDTRDFTIKKIFEWENKENRSEWRQLIGDHFSVT